MSTHPNAILLLTLTPDDLPCKTLRNILASNHVADDDKINIGDNRYNHKVLQCDYDEGWQISGKPGDILIFRLITYGYGEQYPMGDLKKETEALESWADGVCKEHHCSSKVSITANYW